MPSVLTVTQLNRYVKNVLEGDFRPVTKTTLVFSPSGAVSSDDDEYDEEGDN